MRKILFHFNFPTASAKQKRKHENRKQKSELKSRVFCWARIQNCVKSAFVEDAKA